MKILILFTIFLVSCAKELKNTKTQNVKMTKSEYISQNGTPLDEQKNLLSDESTMLIYSDKKVQVTDDKVDSSFRDPQDKEKKIQYWRHKLQDCPYEISEATSTEHQIFFKLNCSSRGITILYDDKGSVLRVVQLLGSQYE